MALISAGDTKFRAIEVFQLVCFKKLKIQRRRTRNARLNSRPKNSHCPLQAKCSDQYKNTKWATGDRVGNKDEWRIETSGIKLSLSPLPPSHPRASGYELCAVYDDVSIKNPPYRACVDSLVFRPKIFYELQVITARKTKQK